ncbi:G protein-coupled receptor gpr1 [Saxophila tyrrhenica]|uniref:G protein-coupled receptor gpr1 n=1 Tax=Saxophila tyrrhenica TaxID=1690608 RepID=A0AAV9NZU7_9PEZI|nr:G protein-coupled receptor gpr1 [Saxophila tyrrhenica]
MPSIPIFGTDGKVFQAAHASLDGTSAFFHNAFSREQVDSPAFSDPKGFNASMVLNIQQQHTVQVLVTCTTSVSLLAAVCAVYWFWMMRRNFRRDLVLLLILGGSWKSLWFAIFSAVTFTQGKIMTETSFCQASGYMLQVGFEMCDFAVLFMSMHMYLQIFPPTRFTYLGHDGLYRVRKWVVAAWFLIPNLTASLAFVNPGTGYIAQGGFCSLPLRPMWYRLALFWIPRYLIWIYVIFVAISITRYVGSEFKVFGQEKDSSTSQLMHSSITATTGGTDKQKGEQDRSAQKLSNPDDDDSSQDCAPDDVESVLKVKPHKFSSPETTTSQKADFARRQSMPAWALGGDSDAASNPFASQSKSTPTSRRGSRQIAHGILSEDFGLPPGIEPSTHRGSIVSMGSVRSSAGVSFEGAPTLPPIAEGLPSGAQSGVPRHSAQKALKFRRAAIQRQLRLLFIYPGIYMLLWIIPFVVNCMNYIDYWAQHPIFALKILQLTVMTIMTFVDVTVFCWREKPWRHIPGSDGTFIGSFMFWRFCFGGTWAQRRRTSRAPSNVPDLDSTHDGKNGSQTGLLASLKRWATKSKRSSSETVGSSVKPHKRTYSGGSDRRHLEAERAAERLALERAEYDANRKSLNERRTSVISQSKKAPLGRKEWFDPQVDETLEYGDEKTDKKPVAP